MSVMRAKMRVNSIKEHFYGPDNTKSQESLTLNAVARSTQYPNDGSDEDNTYAKFTPSASLQIDIANPALFGKFKAGDTYYVDFTPAAQ